MLFVALVPLMKSSSARLKILGLKEAKTLDYDPRKYQYHVDKIRWTLQIFFIGRVMQNMSKKGEIQELKTENFIHTCVSLCLGELFE